MILLIWDSFGEEDLKLYEIAGGTKLAQLAETCDGAYVNESTNSEEVDVALDELSNELQRMTPTGSHGPHGPYSTIYISGFIP